MVAGGFLQKLDMTRIPNIAADQPHVPQAVGGIRTRSTQVPKDYGTTGVLYRSTMIPSIPKSWKEFYDLVKGAGSGKTIFVDSRGDVFIFPLKMLGFSLNSVEKTELDRGADGPPRRGAAPAMRSTPTRTASRWPTASRR